MKTVLNVVFVDIKLAHAMNENLVSRSNNKIDVILCPRCWFGHTENYTWCKCNSYHLRRNSQHILIGMKWLIDNVLMWMHGWMHSARMLYEYYKFNHCFFHLSFLNECISGCRYPNEMGEIHYNQKYSLVQGI